MLIFVIFELKFLAAFDHRDPDFHLVQPEMTVLTCTCKFRIFEPIEEFRQVCPYVLVTIQGPHTHPIPLPTKTLTNVKEKIFGLLDNLAEDLADMTPRRFIRHPTVKAYLRTMFEGVPCPTLSDLHISLANRSHLDAYILQAKEIYFPSGTGWKGVISWSQYSFKLWCICCYRCPSSKGHSRQAASKGTTLHQKDPGYWCGWFTSAWRGWSFRLRTWRARNTDNHLHDQRG